MYMHLESTESTQKRDIDYLKSEIAALKNKNEELLYKLSILENTSDTENIEIIDTKQDNVKFQENLSNINMSLQTLIKENSWFICEKCEYKTKSRKGLKIHIGKFHDSVSIIEIQLKCDQSEKEAVSEGNLKVHNAKWHTKVDPEPGYGYITNMLSKGAKYNFLCLMCEKEVYDRVEHLQEEHDYIDEESIRRNSFDQLD